MTTLPARAATQPETQETPKMLTPTASDYAPVNGVKIHYQTYGEGKPLVLLHGGFTSTEMFMPILPALAAGRQVIGVDLQAHGRTGPLGRPMTFAAMATDIAELIRYLGHEKADVMGYSLGGNTALRTAIDHPDVVDRLVLGSVAETLLRKSKVPVLIARPKALDGEHKSEWPEAPREGEDIHGGRGWSRTELVKFGPRVSHISGML